jgi:hypothetical protein
VAILRAQESSVRYFQRPDREHGGNGLFTDGYDPSLTRMRGFAGYARLAKQSGDWLWEISTNVRSPGFENNEIAFLTQADYWGMNANLRRQWTRPTTWYREMGVTGGAQQQYDFDGNLTDRQVHAAYGVTFPNYWDFFTFWIHRSGVLDPRLTRGGPVVRKPRLDFNYVEIATDSRNSFWLYAFTELGADGDGQRDWATGVGATWRPASNVTLSLNPRFSRNRSAQQYVTSVEDPTATAFSGKRYVFADLRQQTLSMETRLGVTFTPNISLEVFAQPFLSSNRFTRFKEFAAPRSVEKLVYGEDVGTITRGDGVHTVDPDGAGPAQAFAIEDPTFTLRSLRGNAILRWEFIPGSTLFLVWTHSRSDDAPVGDLRLRRDLGELFDAPAENIFLVKLNYWLGL